MSSDLVQQALKRHAYIWSHYREAVGSSPIETHPVAFVVRARTESDTASIAAALRGAHCGIVRVGKKWWPLGRRWEVVAKTEPMPFAEQNIESWVRNTASLVSQFDGALVHYVPFEPIETPAA